MCIDEVTGKKQFECPVHEDEDIENIYTTDECGVCLCFWDCSTGLKECLKDDSFEEYFYEIKETLKELGDYE